MLKCGRFEIHTILTGHVRLDGGAMFGVVPKALWARKQDVDDQNRILLATRTLLAVDRTAKQVILVDTGCGSKWEPEAADRYGVRPDLTAIPGRLAMLGLSEADVTDIIVTHLHFDHNGGVADWLDQEAGSTRLHYPRARHWIHETQWEHAHAPTLKDRASYFPQDFAALEAPGAPLIQVTGDPPRPTLEGIRWFLSQGHTRALLLPIFEGAPRSIFFAGDMIPTSAHLPPPWVMAYDLFPLTTIEEKLEIYRRARKEGLLLAFAHDPALAGVELEPTSEKPIIARVLDLG